MLSFYYKIIKIIETFLNLIIVFSLNIRNIYQKTSYPSCSYDTLLLLGNGPSLSSDLDDISKRSVRSSVMVVNSFASFALYAKIKPLYYIIIDPAYFKHTDDLRLKEIQDSTVRSIINNTKWNLILFLPYVAKDSDFVRHIINKNTFVKINFFKNIPVIGGHKFLNTLLFKFNLANPLFQNVLIAGIFIAIKMNYPNIIIYGADHSWLPNLKVLSDNTVILDDKHIDQKNTNIIRLVEEDGSKKSLHKFLFQISSMFREYHSMKIFADYMQVSIKNMTENSYIDAFEKPNNNVSN